MAESPIAPLPILFQDSRVVVVAKPAGLASIPGRGETDSVLQMLSRQLGIPCSGTSDPRLRIVHRLDKDTSGAMLLVKDIDAQRALSHQFQNNLVKKEYLALVTGRPAANEGTIDAALAPHPPAATAWPSASTAGPPSRVGASSGRCAVRPARCFPQTGKTHQIRVHLHSIGLPLAIDPLYGGRSAGILLSQHKRDYRPKRNHGRAPLISRLTLHAEKLTFTHPGGQTIEIICPPPKDFRAAVTQLQKL